MLTKNIKVDFWVVKNSNFRKFFLPVSGSEVSESSGGKKKSICEKNDDLRASIWNLFCITGLCVGLKSVAHRPLIRICLWTSILGAVTHSLWVQQFQVYQIVRHRTCSNKKKLNGYFLYKSYNLYIIFVTRTHVNSYKIQYIILFDSHQIYNKRSS